MTPHAHGDTHDELDDEPECVSCACDACTDATECAACAVRGAAVRTSSSGGGVAAWAHEALGAGWVDDDAKGGTVEPIGTGDLAQRALGDVFEQLERIGARGRDRCRAGMVFVSAPYTSDQRLSSDEVSALLRLADRALEYARVHLPHLEPPSVPTEKLARELDAMASRLVSVAGAADEAMQLAGLALELRNGAA